jgi:hypothetical protein
MTLAVPTVEEMLVHAHRTGIDDNEDVLWYEDALQRSTDLKAASAEIDEYPTDEVNARIVKTGILAMAYAIFVRTDTKDAAYSPFSSERIGSYSYSKMQSAAKEGATGVEEFDFAIYTLRAESVTAGDSAWTSSEEVYRQKWDAWVLLEAGGDDGIVEDAVERALSLKHLDAYGR